MRIYIHTINAIFCFCKSALFLLVLFTAVACKKENGSTKVRPFKDLQNDSTEELVISRQLPSFKKNANPITIKIPRQDENPSVDSIDSDYTFIPLETTDESLLGEIKKLETDDNYIFVFDQQHGKALQFHQNGKFIRTIGKRGRGPNEYAGIQDMSIDRTKQQICIFDGGGGKFLFYDYDGNCVKEMPQYYSSGNIEFTGTLQVAYLAMRSNPHIPAIDKYQLVINNDKGKPIYSDFPNSEGSMSFRWEPDKPISSFFDGIYYSGLLSDTIWKIAPDGIRPMFVLKFPGRKQLFSPTEIENMTNELYKNRLVGIEFFNGDKLITNKFVYLMVVKKDNCISNILYNRQSNKVVRYDEKVYQESTNIRLGTYFSSIGYNFIFQDSLFVTVLQPSLMLSLKNVMRAQDYRKLQSKDRQILESLKKEDNPVLMLTKLKDF